MTNLDKLHSVEIDGRKIFAHLFAEEAAEMLSYIRCGDCPCADICEDKCQVTLINWLEAEA